MAALSETSKRTVSQKLGVEFDDLMKMNLGDIDELIAKKEGKKSFKIPPVSDVRFLPRGTIYPVMGREIDIEDIDKKITKICKAIHRRKAHRD